MNEQIIQDWLAECSALSPVEVSSYASALKHNVELINALYGVFHNYIKYYSLINPISKQLFNFYRSRENELKLFTLQFLPDLVYIYLNSVAQRDKKSYSSVETLLIGIYNLEVVDDAGQPAVISFRLPSLAQASIYHEPMSLAHASLTETALRRLEECNSKLISWGPHPQVETLNAQNRLKTITGLIFIYNRHIGSLNKMTLKHLCQVSSLLASQGFGIQGAPKPVPVNGPEGSSMKLPRIPVSSQLFLELLCGLYYAMYNDYGYEAMEAVVDIYNRSCLECYANVIIVANAIQNSAPSISKGQPSKGPMGISVAISPATNTVTTVNKSMITNASFRTKKLPDDIPIIPKDDSSGGGEGMKQLSAITEEKEETGFAGRGSSFRGKETMARNLQKLGIGKKLKEGKSSSKTSFAGTGSSERKQSTSMQLTAFIEKVSLKSPITQNGDFVQTDGDGHSSLALSKKKNVEGGSFGDLSKDEVCQDSGKTGSGFGGENQSALTSYGLDTPSSNDEVVSLYSSNRTVEDKPLMQISSV